MSDQTNSLLMLSDSLDKIRQLANDTSINVGIQEKQYLPLAERMAEISRNANTCSGIFFSMHMASRPVPTDEGSALVSKVEMPDAKI